MKITRTMTIETNEIQIGDRIEAAEATAEKLRQNAKVLRP